MGIPPPTRAAPVKLARWLTPFGVKNTTAVHLRKGEKRTVSRSRADAVRHVGASAHRGSVKRTIQCLLARPPLAIDCDELGQIRSLHDVIALITGASSGIGRPPHGASCVSRAASGSSSSGCERSGYRTVTARPGSGSPGGGHVEARFAAVAGEGGAVRALDVAFGRQDRLGAFSGVETWAVMWQPLAQLALRLRPGIALARTSDTGQMDCAPAAFSASSSCCTAQWLRGVRASRVFARWRCGSRGRDSCERFRRCSRARGGQARRDR